MRQPAIKRPNWVDFVEHVLRLLGKARFDSPAASEGLERFHYYFDMRRLRFGPNVVFSTEAAGRIFSTRKQVEFTGDPRWHHTQDNYGVHVTELRNKAGSEAIKERRLECLVRLAKKLDAVLPDVAEDRAVVCLKDNYLREAVGHMPLQPNLLAVWMEVTWMPLQYREEGDRLVVTPLDPVIRRGEDAVRKA